jgi:hypothetical protein
MSEDFDQKTVSKVLFRTGWLSIILPFAISAAFNYLPFWIALPAGVVLSVFLLIFVFMFLYFLTKKISKE